jgi:hypothetical protein
MPIHFFERLRGDVAPLEPKQLQSGRWLVPYARRVLLSTDALLFLCSGIAVALLADHYKEIEADGETVLLALTAVGFAALAVALTALSIFVSLVNDSYLRILGVSKRGGMAGYVVPFVSAGLISALSTIIGAVGAVVYDAVSAGWLKAVILGLEVGFVVWATWAVFQIVVEVAVHGLNRYLVAEELEKAKRPDIADILRDEASEG